MKAIWNGQTIAESDDTIVIEGNHYFPPAALNQDFLTETDYESTCPWKGQASYYSIQVDGKKNENAAWYYPAPKEKAASIKDHVAFWKGVEVTK
ncbi:MAG: DUF427 domain-containing protein [Saprospiraceae bacterium]